MSYFKDDLSERVNRQNRENMGLDNSADRSIFNKRLFDYTSGPRTRPIFLPDPVVVGTPFEALPYFLDAGKTVVDLFKKQRGGDVQVSGYNEYKNMIDKRQMGGSMFVPVDENAYQSTNPTITARPNRLSDRDYYETYLELLSGDEILDIPFDMFLEPESDYDKFITGMAQEFLFPTYDYDAANEFYKRDSIAAEMGGIPDVFYRIASTGGKGYNVRDFSDDMYEDIREYIELTGGKPRYSATPDFQSGGSFFSGDRMTQAEALLAYNEALADMKIAREAFGSNDEEMLRQLGTDGDLYSPNDLRADWNELQTLRKAAGLGVLEDFKITLPHFGQMIRGGYNQMLGTNFQGGGSIVSPTADSRGIIFDPRITGESYDMMIPSAFPANQSFPDPGMPSFEMFDITAPTTLDTLPVVTTEDVEADFEANIGPLMTDSDMDGTIDFYQQEEEIEEGDPRGPFAKLSDAAVNVARGMNKIALRRQARQAERDKRIATSADNLFMVSDPIGARGTFDVQTGLAEPDNLVPYLPMGQMGMELEADEETIRELIAAGAQIKFD